MSSTKLGRARTIRRRAVAVALAGATLGTIASSAGVAGAATRHAAHQAARHAKFHGTLSIMGFGTNGDDVAQTRLRIAERAIAPAKINAPNGGFTDQAFLSDISAGNPPDLVYMNSYQIGTYAAKGALLPLTSCIKSQHINMNEFTKGARAMVTLDGKVWGLPEFTDDRTIIVNDAAVAKAGLTPADVSTTNWKKLAQVAKKLTVFKGGKLQTIGFDPKLPEFFPLWAKANGGAILSPNGLKAELNSPQDIQALTFAKNLIGEQGGYSNFLTYRNTFNYFGTNNPFAENQLAATPYENWMYNVIASTTPNVRVTAVPFTNKKGQVIDYETGSAWVIPKGSKNVSAACEFAKTMTETSTWLAAAKNRIKIYKKKHYIFTGLLTGNHVADNQILKLYLSQKPANGAFVQPTVETYRVESGAFTVPASPASEEVQNAWTSAVTAVLQGQMTPKQALDQAQQQAQTAINQAIGK